MSDSSAPAAPYSKASSKRRRAYVACVTCRKRKIKCITISDADDRPCTRCAQKGIPCEFLAVSDYDDYSSSRPSTPSPDAQGPSHSSDWGQGFQPQIMPPSAGMAGYLGPGPAPSRGSNRSPRPGAPYPQPGSQAYPYPYRPNASRPSGTMGNPQLSHAPPHNSLPYAAGHARGASLNAYYGQGHVAPQFYNAGPSQMPLPPYSSGQTSGATGGPFYNLNEGYGQQYAPPVQPDTTAYQWPQGMPPSECICPPGPCFCGANFNGFNTR